MKQVPISRKHLPALLALWALIGMGWILPDYAWAQDTSQEAATGGDSGKADSKPRIIETKDGWLTVNLDKKQVIVKAEVCLLDEHQDLEFLLSGWMDKTHESLLHTKATGEQIHFGMLMLGLKPGKPYKYIYIDEDRDAALPPRGGTCTLRIRYKDDKGKTHTVDPADWMIATQGSKVPPPEKFVFVGSRVLADGSYLADENGELISVANFGSAVFDVPFESTSSDSSLLFRVDRKKMLPRNTKVELVIQPEPGAQNTPHVRALVEVDRLGQLKADGQPLPAGKLRQWAANLTRDHLKAMVEIRAAPDATVGQVRWVLEELKLGGVFEREVIRLKRIEEFPKTPQARQRLLQEWAQRFADPSNQIQDPADTSARTLEQAKARIAENKAIQHVLQEYVDDLERMRNLYIQQRRDLPPAQKP